MPRPAAPSFTLDSECGSVEISSETGRDAHGRRWTFHRHWASLKAQNNVDPLAVKHGHPTYTVEVKIPNSWHHEFVFVVLDNLVVVQHRRNGTAKGVPVPLNRADARAFWRELKAA